MSDLCLDTNILAELLRQYYTTPAPFRVSERGAISRAVAMRMNQIIMWHDSDSDGTLILPGIIVVSVVAFVEIGRQADAILQGEVAPWQLAAFIEQPPDWCVVEPLGFPVLEEFVKTREGVFVNDKWCPLEGNDNYHAATMMAREQCLLATTDERIRAAYPGLVL